MAPAKTRNEPTPAWRSYGAVALNPTDNVATVLRAMAAGETFIVRIGAQFTDLTAVEPIPYCHNISLRAIAKGSGILKYGTSIGQADTPIAQGMHVHVHNITSLRARAKA